MKRVNALDWRQIRTWNGSQDRAFEELCCQLARLEAPPVPPNARFFRRGTPDGGVECLWRSSDGSESGWQAKFITESPRAKHWGELDDSVRTALEKNPFLRRYTICLPTLLPEDCRPGRISARQRWDEHVEKWVGWSTECGHAVEFILWDESTLIEMLGKPVHAGRRAFWFGAPAFTTAWFAEHGVRPAVRQAHTRYTPPLHIQVPIQQTLTALSRDEEFHRRLFSEGEHVRAVMEGTLRFILNRVEADEAALRDCAKEVVEIMSRWPTAVAEPFDLVAATTIIAATKKAAAEAELSAWRAPSTLGRDRDFVVAEIRELSQALAKLERFLDSPEVGTALLGRLIIVGEAGSGKTHLLCKTAEAQIKRGRPVVLLLGEQFSGAVEPWTQIQQLLGLQATRDEFLGALDAAGEASHCRAMILLDALNEGAGVAYWRRHLGAMVEHLRPFPHVGLAVSVREAYAEDVRMVIGDDAAWVEHRGFRGRVADAARHFFRHYGLAEPNVPVLDPEYENPLFLKLLCETLRSRGDLRLSDPPSFGALLQMVLDDADARLAIALDYDPAERYVHRAVALLSRLMSERRTDLLPWPLVIEELRKLKPSDTRSRSLAQHLLAEDLLVRVPLPGSKSGEECVRFAYQRFSDYLIVSEMLRREQEVGGTGAKTLQRDLAEAEWVPAARSWVEAVATLSPELGGPELPAMEPDYAESAAQRMAFLHSIVWRRRSAISSETEKHLRGLLARKDEARAEAFQIMLSIATRPDHLLNADWLDRFLRPMPMAERDAVWSTAIFGGWEQDGSVRRMIAWAWQEDVAIGLPEEVVRLAAVALAWMLTTSDRFVRDRATKALVSLLEDRVAVLREVLRHFADIAEPYVQERLHAVAYACALRTGDGRELNGLGQEVYDQIFRNGQPPPSVLLRDHARGVVETARRRGASLDYDPKLLVPPYRSEPPVEPSSAEEQRRTFHCDDFDEGHRSLSRIYHSVTDDDFNHYIIRDVMQWSGMLGGVPVRRSPRKLFRAMLKRVPQETADFLEELAGAYERVGWHSQPDEERAELLADLRAVEAKMPADLGRARARLFLTRIKPYLQNPHDPRFNSHFSVVLFERLILDRVLELGWRSELFENFDARVPTSGRESHKPERIGKKYQWIAYDELHARISDNYGLADADTRVMEKDDWERGLWPTDHRDLDPSLLLRATPHDGWGANHFNWWTPHRYAAWLSKSTPGEWLKSSEDVPPLEDFLRLRDSTGQSWLLLDGFHLWRRKVEAQGLWRPERDSQELHLIFRSYLTKARDLSAVLGWAKKQNWINHRLPQPGHHFRVHLFEHYSTPRFDDSLDSEWITDVWPENDLPRPVLSTTEEYLCEHNTYDCSLDSTVKISLPSRWLAAKLALSPSGRNGDFVAADGTIVTFDPSTRERGQSVLLAREDALLDLLAREKMAIFWTVLGEKNYYPPEHSSTWLGRLTLLGSYSYQDGRISGSFRTEFQEGRE